MSAPKIVKTLQAVPVTEPLDPSQQGEEWPVDAESDVAAHGLQCTTTCPLCNSLREVDVDYPNQWFICGNCHQPYRIASATL